MVHVTYKSTERKLIYVVIYWFSRPQNCWKSDRWIQFLINESLAQFIVIM